METSLTISQEKNQGKKEIMIFHLSGWLDAKSEEGVLKIAREVYDEGYRYLLLDLAQVEMITSAGMRTIQKVYKLFTPLEDQHKIAHVKLCKTPTEMNYILGVTGFLLNIPSYATQNEALESFNQ